MKKNKTPQEPEQEFYDKKTYFYIGVAALIASAAAFGMTFSKAGVYALISAVILGIAALSFLNTQKKKNNFKGVFYATVAAYALTAVYLLFFIGGIIYSAL